MDAIGKVEILHFYCYKGLLSHVPNWYFTRIHFK